MLGTFLLASLAKADCNRGYISLGEWIHRPNHVQGRMLELW